MNDGPILKQDRLLSQALDSLITRTRVTLDRGYLGVMQVVVVGLTRHTNPEKVFWSEATYKDAHTPIIAKEASVPFVLNWKAPRGTEDDFDRIVVHGGSGGRCVENGPHLNRCPLWKKGVRHLVVVEDNFYTDGRKTSFSMYERFEDTQVTERFLYILNAMRGALGIGKKLNEGSPEFKTLDYQIGATIDHVRHHLGKPIVQMVDPSNIVIVER